MNSFFFYYPTFFQTTKIQKNNIYSIEYFINTYFSFFQLYVNTLTIPLKRLSTMEQYWTTGKKQLKKHLHWSKVIN